MKNVGFPLMSASKTCTSDRMYLFMHSTAALSVFLLGTSTSR